MITGHLPRTRQRTVGRPLGDRRTRDRHRRHPRFLARNPGRWTLRTGEQPRGRMPPPPSKGRRPWVTPEAQPPWPPSRGCQRGSTSFALPHHVGVRLPFEFVQTFRMDHHFRASPVLGRTARRRRGPEKFGFNRDQYRCDGLVSSLVSASAQTVGAPAVSRCNHRYNPAVLLATHESREPRGFDALFFVDAPRHH